MYNIFVSYSHEDESLRKELDKHLSQLKNDGLINTWNDRMIKAGENIHNEIDNQLNQADIVLLLVSPDYLFSEYCYDKEMKPAVKLHNDKKTHVIPIILRICDWHSTPFGNLNAVPPDGKPITKYNSLDDGFYEVTKAIRQLVKSISDATSSNGPQPTFGSAVHTSYEPRSSNLKLRKEYTDYDRRAFAINSIQHIALHFKNSLVGLEEENDQAKTEFMQLNPNKFEASVYIDGKERLLCGIWLGGSFNTNGLNFSYDRIGDGSKINGWMSVTDDGYNLFLQPAGMSNFTSQMNSLLTKDDAAEYFWGLFLKPHQSTH